VLRRGQGGLVSLGLFVVQKFRGIHILFTHIFVDFAFAFSTFNPQKRTKNYHNFVFEQPPFTRASLLG